MEKNNVFNEKIFNFEDRLVRFAGECILFTRNLNKSYENEYYKNQLIRSSGSSSLNFGEARWRGRLHQHQIHDPHLRELHVLRKVIHGCLI